MISTPNKTLSVWELAIAQRTDIEFTAFSLRNRLVIAAQGSITVNNKQHRVKWDNVGNCYYGSKRLRDFDINL